MFVLFLQTFVEPIECFLLLRLCPQKPRKLIQDSRFEIRNSKHETLGDSSYLGYDKRANG